MDYRLEQWINGPAGSHPVLDGVMTWVGADLLYVFVAVVVAWFLVGWWRGHPDDRRGAIAAGLALVAGLVVNFIIASVWARPRPFVAHPTAVHLLLHHGRDASFPSDHAVMTFAVAAVLFVHHRRLGALALAAAALVCYARVFVGDHYPGDVAAGAAIGVVAALLFSSWGTAVPAFLREMGDDIIRALHLPLREERGA
ncbi:MAG: phosphatase PAP2 family protein [Candidatus Dormibacteraceae bacterium]